MSYETVVGNQNSATIAILTQLVDRLYGDLVKAQGDLKAANGNNRAQLGVIQELREANAAKDRQIGEMDEQITQHLLKYDTPERTPL